MALFGVLCQTVVIKKKSLPQSHTRRGIPLKRGEDLGKKILEN